MDLSTLYLIVMLPTLGNFMAITFGFITVILIGMYFIGLDKEAPWHGMIKKGYIILPILLWVMGIMMPNQTQMQYLIDGYAVTNIEGIEKLPKNVMGAANKFLEDFNIEDKK